MFASPGSRGGRLQNMRVADGGYSAFYQDYVEIRDSYTADYVQDGQFHPRLTLDPYQPVWRVEGFFPTVFIRNAVGAQFAPNMEFQEYRHGGNNHFISQFVWDSYNSAGVLKSFTSMGAYTDITTAGAEYGKFVIGGITNSAADNWGWVGGNGFVLSFNGTEGQGRYSMVATNGVYAWMDDAANSSVSYVLELKHTTTGTPSGGIGPGIKFKAETLSGEIQIGDIQSVWTAGGAANEYSAMYFDCIAQASSVRVLDLVGDDHDGGHIELRNANTNLGTTAQFAAVGTSADIGIKVLAKGNNGPLYFQSRHSNQFLNDVGTVNVTYRRTDAHGSNVPVAAFSCIGTDSAAGIQGYGQVQFYCLDNTSGSEDAIIQFKPVIAGVETENVLQVYDKVTCTRDDATNNSTTYTLRVTHTTTGTPAAGIGVGQEFEVETASGTNKVIGTVIADTVSVTPGSEQCRMLMRAMWNGSLPAVPNVQFQGDGRMTLQGSGAALELGDRDGVGSWFIYDNADTLRWFDSTDRMFLTSTVLSPGANDGLALGSTTLMWSDLFLASGAVVNFNNGDVTLTHSTDLITVAGGGVKVAAGTTAIAPITYQSGTNLTTAAAGATEFDGSVFYQTAVASARQVVNCEQIQALSSNRTFTNNTSAQAIFNATANGAVTLAASTTYEFEMLVVATGFSSSAHTINLTFAGTATYTSIGYYFNAQTGSTLATPTTTLSGYVAVATATAVIASSTTTGLNLYVRGVMRINAGGTVIPQLTQVTASAAAVVQLNSFFRVWPIGTNTVTNVGNWS